MSGQLSVMSIHNPQELLVRELFDTNVSLGLRDLSQRWDVWNLMVDTADPSNFQVRSRLAEDAMKDMDEDSEPGVQGCQRGFGQGIHIAVVIQR